MGKAPPISFPIQYETKENKYPCGCIVTIHHIGESLVVNFCPEHQIPSFPDDAINIYMSNEAARHHIDLMLGRKRETY